MKATDPDFSNFPDNWSILAKDFCKMLLSREPKRRLGGFKSVGELKNHPWFRGIHFEGLDRGSLESPLYVTESYEEDMDKLRQLNETKYDLAYSNSKITQNAVYKQRFLLFDY